MAPIELDDYGPSSAAAASTPGTGEVDSTSDPLLRHARFASPPPDNDELDDRDHRGNNEGYSAWRRSSNRRRSGSVNSGTFTRNSRRFPLMLVGIIGVPVLLLSLIYGIIRGNAPEYLPDLHLPDILAPIKLTESLSRRCVCGTEDSKRDTEGKRVCEVYGKDGLLRSRLHEGTGNRIKDFVRHARTGKKLKVGIMGGSVSACHGLHLKPGFPGGDPAGPGCYPTIFVDWLHKAFPMPDGQEHEIFNGAIGAMDSSYYAFCGTHHIPPDVNLIILEFDVNDQANLAYQAFFDQLLRVLLELPSKPAVLILGAWSPQIAQDQGYGDPQIAHLPVAHYYDVPYLSLKRVIWNQYLRWPKEVIETFYQPDKVHPKARGHRIMADLLIAYFEGQMCEYDLNGVPNSPPVDVTAGTTLGFGEFVDAEFPFDSIKPGEEAEGDAWESTYDADALDKMAYEKKLFVEPIDVLGIPFTPIEQPLRDFIDPNRADPGDAKHLLDLVQPTPFCADANDPVSPMKPTVSIGWERFVWMEEKHFWKSKKPGSKISVDIEVNQGRVAIYYWRSATLAGGTVSCWVDDNERGSVQVASWWDRPYNMASVWYIDEKVTPGKHYVTCKLLDQSSNPNDDTQREFRLVAVMAT